MKIKKHEKWICSAASILYLQFVMFGSRYSMHALIGMMLIIAAIILNALIEKPQ
jgi:multidrug transporter EmrE-like cation transporter